MRIASFNIENLDETTVPSLEERITVLKPQLNRLNADILCLQEVHGQERPGERRELIALQTLIQNTQYEDFHIAYTETTADEAYDKRNLVTLSRFPILEAKQIRNDYIKDLMYRRSTAIPEEDEPKKVFWERPILHTKVDHPHGVLDVINIHLKSRIPSHIPGQSHGYSFKSASGWAEGYFLSSMKRVGQALEVRCLIDEILDRDVEAKIVVCGDYNAEPGQVPVEAIAGRVENTNNSALSNRQLIACSDSISTGRRFTHLHEGQGNLLDHIMISRSLLAYYQSAEIHNEILHDETISNATDKKYPESDHAPFIANFNL